MFNHIFFQIDPRYLNLPVSLDIQREQLFLFALTSKEAVATKGIPLKAPHNVLT